jgi:hypothetical protein
MASIQNCESAEGLGFRGGFHSDNNRLGFHLQTPTGFTERRKSHDDLDVGFSWGQRVDPFAANKHSFRRNIASDALSPVLSSLSVHPPKHGSRPDTKSEVLSSVQSVRLLLCLFWTHGYMLSQGSKNGTRHRQRAQWA